MKLKPHKNTKIPKTIRKLDEHMVREGIVHNGRIISNGNLHTFHIEGDDENSRNGFYIAYNTDVFAAIFGSLKTGQIIHFSYVPVDKLSPTELASYDGHIAHAERQFQTTLKAYEQEQIDSMLSVLQESEAADPNHAFLVSKKIGPHQLLQDGPDLLVPICLDAKVVNILVVSADGKRRLMAKTSLMGAYTQFGVITKDTIVVCLDIESAASINETTGLAAVAAIKSGNLRDCVKRMKEQLPSVRFIVAATNDELNDGSPFLTRAREVAEEFDAALAVPIFHATHLKTIPYPKTYSDLRRLHETDAIVCSITNAKTMSEEVAVLSDLQGTDEYSNEMNKAIDTWGCSAFAFEYRIELYNKYSTHDRYGGDILETTTIPWFKEMELKPIASMIRGFFNKYADLPPGADVILTLSIIGTYFHRVFNYWPIMCVTSPTKGCGKSTVVGIYAATCLDAAFTSDISVPSLARIIELYKSTVVLDEVDAQIQRDKDIALTFNCMVNKMGTKRVRSVKSGDDYVPKAYRLCAPTVIAMIDAHSKLPPTALDRCNIIQLHKKLPTEEFTPPPRDFTDQCAEIRRQLLRIALDSIESFAMRLKDFRPDISYIGNDRHRDNFRPLLAIAELLLGEEWPALAVESIKQIGKRDIDDEELKVILLSDIQQVTSTHLAPRIHSQNLVDLLLDMEGRPWSELPSSGRKLTSTKLADMLRSFGIKSAQMRINDTNRWGYEIAAFKKVFERYIPDVSRHSSISSRNGAGQLSKNVSPTDGVRLLKCGLPRWEPNT